MFAVILLGAGARWFRLLDAAGLRGLNDLTYYLGIPALLFASVIEAPSFRVLDVSVLYFGACLVVFAVRAWWSRAGRWGRALLRPVSRG